MFFSEGSLFLVRGLVSGGGLVRFGGGRVRYSFFGLLFFFFRRILSRDYLGVCILLGDLDIYDG